MSNVVSPGSPIKAIDIAYMMLDGHRQQLLDLIAADTGSDLELALIALSFLWAIDEARKETEQ
jgi:hypothetical protein